MFSTILIANRGEIAVRIVRACRDIGISPAVVYSDADRDSLHVKIADQAVCIGGAAASESYLNIPAIIEAARATGSQAIHPGYGFLSENGEFARACLEAGITFIGPTPAALAIMGSKISARELAASAGVPGVPGSQGPVEDVDQALREAHRLGYPVMLKASAGGGGKGLRLASGEAELRAAFDITKAEARSSFGDPTVYIEKQIVRARHVEVQVFGDLAGNVIHLGERECSIQRRHQKIFEEAPSPAASAELRALWGEAAVKIARAAGYTNAGTVEFLVDATDPNRFYFLEMNTRLQVEHPVTEQVTGLDLVCEQIRVAAGERLSVRQEDVRFSGAAIEARVYAEDPARNFMPAPGTVTDLFEPAGPGIRNESSLYAGYTIPVHYDPLISKLIAFGRDRQEAIRRLRRGLAEFRVGGVPTNIPFLLAVLDEPDFVSGNLTTRFLEEHAIQTAGEDDESMAPLLAVALSHVSNVSIPASGEPGCVPASSQWRQAARPGFGKKWRL